MLWFSITIKQNWTACTLCGNREHKTELLKQEVKSELINVENVVAWLKAVYNSDSIISWSLLDIKLVTVTNNGQQTRVKIVIKS